MSNYNEELKQLRIKIDALDTEIVDALVKRFEISREIGKLKAQHGVEEMSVLRQLEIIERLSARSEISLLTIHTLIKIYEIIFEDSILCQEVILLQNQKTDEDI